MKAEKQLDLWLAGRVHVELILQYKHHMYYVQRELLYENITCTMCNVNSCGCRPIQ
jgi:hypothetical protein